MLGNCAVGHCLSRGSSPNRSVSDFLRACSASGPPRAETPGLSFPETRSMRLGADVTAPRAQPRAIAPHSSPIADGGAAQVRAQLDHGDQFGPRWPPWTLFASAQGFATTPKCRSATRQRRRPLSRGDFTPAWMTHAPHSATTISQTCSSPLDCACCSMMAPGSVEPPETPMQWPLFLLRIWYSPCPMSMRRQAW